MRLSSTTVHHVNLKNKGNYREILLLLVPSKIITHVKGRDDMWSCGLPFLCTLHRHIHPFCSMQ